MSRVSESLLCSSTHSVSRVSGSLLCERATHGLPRVSAAVLQLLEFAKEAEKLQAEKRWRTAIRQRNEQKYGAIRKAGVLLLLLLLPPTRGPVLGVDTLLLFLFSLFALLSSSLPSTSPNQNTSLGVFALAAVT